MGKLSLINKQFIKAIQNNQIDKVKNLLDQGADIHDDNDWALRESAFCGDLETVKFLVTKGANIHANDDEALRESAQEGHLEIVKFLLSKGANIHVNDDEALRESAQNGRDDVWRVLSAFIQEEKLLLAIGSAGMPQTKLLPITKAKRSKI